MQPGQLDAAQEGAYEVGGMPQWWRRVPLRARLLMLAAVVSGAWIYLAEPLAKSPPPPLPPTSAQAQPKASIWDWLTRSPELNAMQRPALLGTLPLLAVGADWVLDTEGQMRREREGRWAPSGEKIKTGAGLLSAHCASDGQACWAVDSQGMLHRRLADTWLASADDELRWQADTLWFAEDGRRGFGVDLQGRLLSSDDGGVRWQPRASEGERAFSRLRFSADLRVGVAVGEDGLLLISRDGGQSWHAGSVEKRLQLRSVAISGDGAKIWLLGDFNGWKPQLLSSADTGRSWDTRDLPAAASRVRDVLMSADGRQGWIFGDAGTLLGSDDGGKSWQALETGLRVALAAGHLQGERLRVVGDGGSLLQGTGGGRSWQLLAGLDGRLLGRVVLSGADGRQAWMVSAAGGVFKSSSSDWKEWKQVANIDAHLPLDMPVMAVSRDGRRVVVIGGAGQLLRTEDGGTSWKRVQLDNRPRILAVSSSADGSRLWALGRQGRLFTSRDAGQTWTSITAPSKENPQALHLSADGGQVWVADATGKLWLSTNAGQKWQSVGDAVAAGPRALQFDSKGEHGLLLVEGGRVYASQNGGKNWDRVSASGRETLVDVQLDAQGQRAWALTQSGQLLTSPDAGRTWLETPAGQGGAALGLRMRPDGQTGLLSGDGLVLIQDGGLRREPIVEYLLQPAPWYWLMTGTLLIAMLLLLALAIRHRPVVEIELGTGHKALPDQPVDRTELDRLGFGPVVQAISAFMRHVSTKPPVVIAITAPWGRGKSSMMRMLEDQRRQIGACTVWFNAWHHQQEPVLLAPLLSTLQQSLPPWFSVRGLRFRNRLVFFRFLAKPWQGLLPLLMWWGLQGAVLLSVLAALTGQSQAAFDAWADAAADLAEMLLGSPILEAAASLQWGALVKATLGALAEKPWEALPQAFFAGLLLLNLFWLLAYYLRAFPLKPSVLMSSVGARFNLAKAEQQTQFRQQFRDHFAVVCRAMAPRHLTLFIDDLDRCEPKKSVEMLEAVNYLSDAGSCFIVLGIAPEVIEAQLGEEYGALADRVASFEAVQAVERGEALGGIAAIVSTQGTAGVASTLGADTLKALQGSWQRQRFARSYLRKLIQIRVAVPAFDPLHLRAFFEQEFSEERSGRAMLPENDEVSRLLQQLRAQRAAAQRRSRLARRRERWSWVLRGGFVLFLLASCLQALEMWQMGREQHWNEVWERRAHELLAIESQYTQALGHSMAMKLGMEQRRQQKKKDWSAAIGWASEDAERQRLQRRFDKLAPAIDALRENYALRQESSFDQSRLRLHEQLQELREQLAMNEPEWASSEHAEVRSDADGAFDTPAAGSPLLEPSAAGERYAPQRAGVGSGRFSGDSTAEPPQHSLLAMSLVAAVLLAVIGISLTAVRDRYEIKPAAEYLKAVEHWHSLLLLGEGWRAPREAKRFLNLSRYLTMRLNPQRYGMVPEAEPAPMSRWQRLKRWLLPPSQRRAPEFPENHVVALTALHLHAASALVRPEDKLACLSDPWGFVNAQLNESQPLLPRDQLQRLRDELAAVRERSRQAPGADGAEQPGVLDIGPTLAARFLAALGELGEPDAGAGAGTPPDSAAARHAVPGAS